MSRCLRHRVLLIVLGACLAYLPWVVLRSQTLVFAAGSAWNADQEGKREGHELFFKVINFALLVGALAYLLRKPAVDFFATRSSSIRKSLEEGRKALEASQAQLQAVEEKLRRLEEEIAAFKASAVKEMEVERQRLREAATEEAEKILVSARARIETSVRAAKLDLKTFAAQQAVELAEELIRQRLDNAGREHLVSQFVAKLEARERKN